MSRLRATQALESQEPEELDGCIEELIGKSLDQEGADLSEVTRKIMRGVVESIQDIEDADWAIRRASRKAVLTVAKRWGNVVIAGKASVVGCREAAGAKGLDTARAAQQAGLGAMEGVLQVGPIAYPALQREIQPIVEDLQEVLEGERRSGEWMLRSLERLPVVESSLEETTPVDEPITKPETLPLPTSTVPTSTVPTSTAPADAAPPPPTAKPKKKSLWDRAKAWVRSLFGGR